MTSEANIIRWLAAFSLVIVGIVHLNSNQNWWGYTFLAAQIFMAIRLGWAYRIVPRGTGGEPPKAPLSKVFRTPTTGSFGGTFYQIIGKPD